MKLYNWTRLNPAIGFVPTKKKLFNQFYYSLRYYCPGGRIISNGSNSELTVNDIAPLLAARKLNFTMFNSSRSWQAGRERIDGVSQDQLIAFFNVRAANLSNLRFRIEEPYIKIYAETEEMLYNIAANELSSWKADLVDIQRPESQHIIDLLATGAILSSKGEEFRYKVILRDGRYTADIKQTVYSYLVNLNDLVKLSPTVVRNLTSKQNYMWGVWFYTNDKDITTMLTLINPNLVANIHELVSLAR